MKHEPVAKTMTQAPSVARGESQSPFMSLSTTSSRARLSSKSKDSSSSESKTVNGVSKTIKSRRNSAPRDMLSKNTHTPNTKRSLEPNKPKILRIEQGKELEQSTRLTRPQGLSVPHMRRKKEGEQDRKDLVLRDKLDQCEALIRDLQAEVLELKVELIKKQDLNVELQSQNMKLSDQLAAARAKIATLSGRYKDTDTNDQGPTFKDIQKLISHKLEYSKAKDAARETSSFSMSSAAACIIPTRTNAEIKVPDSPSTLPTQPPPPPPPLPRFPARASTSGKAPAVVQLHKSFKKNDSSRISVGANSHVNISTAHNSIVGEIQNRSSHLLAIKSDIETKGEFVNGLIRKVLDAAFTDIEDVLKFVDWLDTELSTLADERAVLKHFKWPEKKADSMREAAMEYRGVRCLESEISSFKDDVNIPCEVALRKMACLLDKSEKSIQKLIKLRSSVIPSYQEHQVPTEWMLDSGIVCKIKQAARVLANLYVKRITMELESMRYSERGSNQEALLLQGVHFAYRAHQFAGGLDSEALCTFEEIRQRVPVVHRGNRELLVGIPSS